MMRLRFCHRAHSTPRLPSASGTSCPLQADASTEPACLCMLLACKSWACGAVAECAPAVVDKGVQDLLLLSYET